MFRNSFRASASRLWSRGRRSFLSSTVPLRRSFVQSWILPAILNWEEPARWPRETAVEIHLLTSERDWACAAWTLASLVHFTERRWPLVVHDDGTLSEAARTTLRRMFPDLKVLARAEADARMAEKLTGHPRCRRYRESHPLALKLFDCSLLAETPRLIVLDSDIVFFQKPVEVLAWVESGARECLFNPDFQDAYCLTRADAQARLGVALWPRVNTGLSLLPREAVDLDFCERCLSDEALDDPESIAWREQTLLALCASRFGTGGLLSPRYEVNFNPEMADDAITRHYVGDMRPLFYTEGVWRTRRQIFA